MATLKKDERLCSRNQIKELFEKGKSINAHPIKLIWKKSYDDTQFPVQIVFAVPKKNIRKAFLRNKIKRRIREAYRNNKYILNNDSSDKQVKCTAIFIFTGKEEISFKVIEIKIIELLMRLKYEYEKSDS